MKLILLPGMDGTGVLFRPLLEELGDIDTQVVPLPNSGAQDYASLAEYLAKAIGAQECVLLAESFSGGIAEVLARNDDLNIRHIIFVASFLSSPSPTMARLAAVLPIRALASVPVIAPLMFKALLLGWSANHEIISLFRKALGAVHPAVLRMRLRHIAKYRSTGEIKDISATYIRPTADLLVSDRSKEFTAAFPNLKIVAMAGPHFILQAEPKACAEAIMAAIGHLTDLGNGVNSALRH